jgi:hypothetical protein
MENDSPFRYSLAFICASDSTLKSDGGHGQGVISVETFNLGVLSRYFLQMETYSGD